MFYRYNDDLSIQLYEEDKPLILDAGQQSELKEISKDDVAYGFNSAPYLKSDITSDRYLQLKKEYDDREEKYALLKYLADTDYVITKLNEAQLEDDGSFSGLKIQYADVLSKRKEARIRLSELS